MEDLGMTHIGLPVSDLDTSIAFYHRFAGFEVVHRRRGVAWISDRTRPFAIVLLQMEGPIAPLASPAHLGVALRSREEVDRMFALARADGIVIAEPRQEPEPVGYWGCLRDPDGHTLELAYGQRVDDTVGAAQPGHP